MMNKGRAIIKGFHNGDIEEDEVVEVNPKESTKDSEDESILKAILIIVIFGLIDTALLIGLYLK